ncbi:MAG: methylenetetrahydrofolate reductase C-terminal domain-containing protein [Bacteroidales bacterium]|nr:methylenetetrahydrofolate reductase C-terminal domain-containing protein [Bacteroidales bacterium]
MALFTPLRRWQPAFRPFSRQPAGRRLLALTERVVKGPLFGCRMCGNCLLQETAFICHMACPKGLRNGPCGGVNNGYCYVDPTRRCAWHLIYERSYRMHREHKLLEVLPPVDWDRAGTETWGEVVRTARMAGLRTIFFPSARKGITLGEALEEKVFRPIRQPDWWRGDSEYHPPAVTEPQSALERELRSGRFVITAEVTPPLTATTARLREKITTVKPFVTAINFTDGSSAVPRMSSAACSAVAASLGADPVMQISARDTTRNSLQSMAIGANALGVHNILCLSGDSPRVGPAPRSSMNIVDIDSVQMLWILRRMRDEGIYLDGREIKNRPKLFLGAALAPFAQDPALQAIRIRKKIYAGAQFLQTNLVFDPDSLDPLLEQMEKNDLLGKVFLLVGISPLKSLSLAKYLNSNIPGVKVPDAIMKRLADAGTRLEEESIAITAENLKKLSKKHGVSGVHIMPLGWEDSLPVIIKRATDEAIHLERTGQGNPS